MGDKYDMDEILSLSEEEFAQRFSEPFSHPRWHTIPWGEDAGGEPTEWEKKRNEEANKEFEKCLKKMHDKARKKRSRQDKTDTNSEKR